MQGGESIIEFEPIGKKPLAKQQASERVRETKKVGGEKRERESERNKGCFSSFLVAVVAVGFGGGGGESIVIAGGVAD